ncbi:MAG: hypothetical protein Q9183_001478 [Haloplaca sp. 2 TL-2023]
MSTLTANSPLRLSHSEALGVSQQAGSYVQSRSSAVNAIQLPFFTTPESAELWNTYENLLLSCLRTGDDKTAHVYLEKLAGRFGANNERVMGLRALYQEAMADDTSQLSQILREYDEILFDDPTNTPIKKRRVALLCGLSRRADAIEALVRHLEASPNDIESWAELSELYVSQGCYQQAEFCLEEILLSTPNAWNVGSSDHLGKTPAEYQDKAGLISESIRRFCRSIELCDGYLRGFYGLELATRHLLEMKNNPVHQSNTTPASGSSNSSELPTISVETLRRLNQKATSTLAEMARVPRDHGPGPPHTSGIGAVDDLMKSSTMFRER